MVAKNKKKGVVQFSIKPPSEAVQVYLAGTFKEWQPLPMKRQRDGSFALQLKLPPGVHEYKFVLDKEWVTDPDHSQYVQNAYGSFNSVVQVE